MEIIRKSDFETAAAENKTSDQRVRVCEKLHSLMTLDSEVHGMIRKTVATALQALQLDTLMEGFSDVPPKEKPIAESLAVLVYPSAGGEHHPQASSDILSDIRTHIDIRTHGIRVMHTRSIRNGGLVVQLFSKKDVDNFVRTFQAHPIVSQRYTIKIPVKLDPRVIVFEVDSHVSGEAILKAIADMVDGETHRARIVQKKSTLRGHLNYVVSLDGDTFRKVVAIGKLPVDWAMYNVIEYDTVKQCHRCGRFGHLTQFCRRDQRCVRCGDTQHLLYGSKDWCERPVHCSNCSDKNRYRVGRSPPLPTDHSYRDRECPTRMAEVKKFKERNIDYGKPV